MAKTEAKWLLENRIFEIDFEAGVVIGTRTSFPFLSLPKLYKYYTCM